MLMMLLECETFPLRLRTLALKTWLSGRRAKRKVSIKTSIVPYSRRYTALREKSILFLSMIKARTKIIQVELKHHSQL
jgi:hypothetical protein